MKKLFILLLLFSFSARAEDIKFSTTVPEIDPRMEKIMLRDVPRTPSKQWIKGFCAAVEIQGMSSRLIFEAQTKEKTTYDSDTPFISIWGNKTFAITLDCKKFTFKRPAQ